MNELKNNIFYQLSEAMNDTEIYLCSEYGEQGCFSLKDGLRTIFYWYTKDITQNWIPIDTSISEYIEENCAIFVRII